MGFSSAVSGPFWAVVGRLGGLWPCWGSPGGLVGLSWEPLWALLGLSGGCLGALLGCLGALLGHVGALWGRLGAHLDRFGALLEAS